MLNAKKIVALFAVLCTVIIAGCTGKNYVSFSAKNKILFVPNHVDARMMADLAQIYTGVTYILYQAPTGSNEAKIYPILPNEEDPVALPLNKLASCLHSYGTKQVIILGDDRYVPTKVEEEINSKLPEIMTVRYGNENWPLQAKYLGRALLCERIGVDFPKLQNERMEQKRQLELEEALKK